MTPNQILILVSIITLGLLIYLITLLRGSIQKQETENDDDSKRDIENIAMAVDKLQENITRFKDPMGKLNAFMVGSSQAGSFAEWNLRSIISDFIPDEMVEENCTYVSLSIGHTACTMDKCRCQSTLSSSTLTI